MKKDPSLTPEQTEGAPGAPRRRIRTATTSRKKTPKHAATPQWRKVKFPPKETYVDDGASPGLPDTGIAPRYETRRDDSDPWADSIFAPLRLDQSDSCLGSFRSEAEDREGSTSPAVPELPPSKQIEGPIRFPSVQPLQGPADALPEQVLLLTEQTAEMAPVSEPVLIGSSDTPANRPRPLLGLVWNGLRHGLHLMQSVRGPLVERLKTVGSEVERVYEVWLERTKRDVRALHSLRGPLSDWSKHVMQLVLSLRARLMERAKHNMRTVRASLMSRARQAVDAIHEVSARMVEQSKRDFRAIEALRAPLVHRIKQTIRETPSRWASVVERVKRVTSAFPSLQGLLTEYSRPRAGGLSFRTPVVVAVCVALISIALFQALGREPRDMPDPSGLSQSSLQAKNLIGEGPKGATTIKDAVPVQQAIVEVNPAPAEATRGGREPAVRSRQATSGTGTEGRLVIRSTPAAARVTVNGIGWGETPLTMERVPLGSHVIRLTKPGFRTEQKRVMLSSNQPRSTATFVLKRRGG